MQKRWTQEDGNLLRQLRERTGVDRPSFSRRHTLSTHQLTELEDGGTGRFYSDDIKAYTGHKLLRKLGHVPVVVVPQPEPEPELPQAVPEPIAVPQQPAVQARVRRDSPVQPELAVFQPPAQRQAQPPLAEPSARASEAAPQEPAETDVVRPRARLRVRVPLLVFSFAALVGLTVYAFLAPGPASPQAGSLQSQQVVLQTVAVAPVAAPEPPAAAASPGDAPAPVMTPVALAAPATAPAAVTASPGTCDPGSRDGAVQYRSPSATRPGTYVFVQSVKDASFCVIDAQNKQTLTSLRPGEGITVAGVPPFLIHTSQWSDLRVFFQGLRVNVEAAPPLQTVLLSPL